MRELKSGVETFVSSAPKNLFYRGKDGFYCGSILISHYAVAPRNESIEEFMQNAFKDELKNGWYL